MKVVKRLAIDAPSPDFDLPGVDGKRYALKDFAGREIVVVMFTCNHCPYVQAYEDRLIDIQRDYVSHGVALVAINSNETVHHPEDSFEKMKERARAKSFNFPYLRDEDQSVATAYGAHYTPEVFVFDRERRLQYTGRIDDSWQSPEAVKEQTLRDVLDRLLSGQRIAHPETHAMGCTIKWAT